MKEDQSLQSTKIIITKLKKQCENAKLKGFHFIPEGYSIYTEI